MNLRPSVTSVGAILDEVTHALGASGTWAGALTTMPGLCFALAGFGAPVAITGVMLMALGFSPVRAAVVVLLANTAPVAFGAVAIPITTAGALTDLGRAA